MTRCVCFTALAAALSTLAFPSAQVQDELVPIAYLAPASRIAFIGPTDSNSPAYWLLRRGLHTLFVMNSNGDGNVLSYGRSVATLGRPVSARFNNVIDGPRWFEAVIPDVDGTLYGYYHNEPVDPCETGSSRTAPRIGAAKSTNQGLIWEDLGIILEAPPESMDCSTINAFFTGGFGDFSAILDRDRRDLYFFFSVYHRAQPLQGVAVARMAWGDRDEPQGKLSMWDAGIWREAGGTPRPIIGVSGSWHDREGEVDAYWGPSLHWNTFLEMYVMLLNRASDASWSQQGSYIAFATQEEFPTRWSRPRQILNGGNWYPQVIGLQPREGTDKEAGERAQFFMGGVSQHEIVFERLP